MKASLIARTGIIVICCVLYFGCSKVTPTSLGGGLDVVVLCSSCVIRGHPGGYAILLDQRSGKVWAYGEFDPRVKPIYLGTLSKLGEQMTFDSSLIGAEVTRAKNQSCAVGSLRTINTAEVTYASTYTTGYSFDLASLDGRASPSTASSAGLIDSQLASGVKCGYRFTYVANPSGGRVDSYAVYADPLESGANHYYTDQSGVIRQNADRRAGPNDLPLAG
jgi:type IV pilus assembly protein PilA